MRPELLALTGFREENSEFEPQLIKKNQTRFDGFDDKIISLYARGMTTREIQGHLEEIYGVELSPSLISTVTDTIIDEVKQWQFVNTFSVTGTKAVTESGVLNASSSGVLLARQVFSAINVVNGDSLQITWKFQMS